MTHATFAATPSRVSPSRLVLESWAIRKIACGRADEDEERSNQRASWPLRRRTFAGVPAWRSPQ